MPVGDNTFSCKEDKVVLIDQLFQYSNRFGTFGFATAICIPTKMEERWHTVNHYHLVNKTTARRDRERQRREN